MIQGKVFKILILLNICFAFFLLLNGCKEVPVPLTPSSIPDKELLKQSKFAQFVNELKALAISQRLAAMQPFLIENSNSPVFEENGLACFYWFGNASSVLINGDIQSGWSIPDTMEALSCGNEIFFYKIYSLPADARLDYEYIIDGASSTDPRNPIINPSGYTLHSETAMPLFKHNPVREFRPSVPMGSIDSFYFQSKLTSVKPRMIKIYKPFGYDSLSNLPSLFINDGFKAMEYSSYTTILDNLIADKKISPLLAVFIDYKEGDQDYFLIKTEEYMQAICDELLPAIDRNYKTSNSPERRAIVGTSAGGNISLLTALKRPDIFLNAAGQSTTTTDQLFDALKEAAANEKIHKAFRFYFDVGRYDLSSGAAGNNSFLYANQLLNKEMKGLMFKYVFHIFNDGHQWAGWRERIDEILIYFFSKNLVHKPSRLALAL